MSVCCTFACEKYMECMKSEINNVGTHAVVSYGTCYFNDKPMCGKENGYKMFESKVRKDDEIS